MADSPRGAQHMQIEDLDNVTMRRGEMEMRLEPQGR